LNIYDLVDVAVATILAHASLGSASADELLVMMRRVLGRAAGKPELKAFLVELVHRRTLKRQAVVYNDQMSRLHQQYQEAQMRGDESTAEELHRKKMTLVEGALPVLAALLSIPDPTT